MEYKIDYSELLNPLNEVVKKILVSIGLINSNLIKNFEIIFIDNEVKISFPSYAIFIDSGRKPNSKMPPTKFLISWIREKNIQIPKGYTEEGFVFAIAKSIGKKGIKPKPFIDNLLEIVFQMVSEFTSIKISESLDLLVSQV